MDTDISEPMVPSGLKKDHFFVLRVAQDIPDDLPTSYEGLDERMLASQQLGSVELIS